RGRRVLALSLRPTPATSTSTVPAAPAATATLTGAIATLPALLLLGFPGWALRQTHGFGVRCRTRCKAEEVSILARLHQLDQVRVIRLPQEALEPGSAYDG